jgi:hypothetical protein
MEELEEKAVDCHLLAMLMTPHHTVTMLHMILVHMAQCCRFEGAQEAVQIIARGPERIQSQFTVSYSMVLNLLSTRTVPEIQGFLARSFMRYQATAGAEAAAKRMEGLQARVDELDAQASKVLGQLQETEDMPSLQAAQVPYSTTSCACLLHFVALVDVSNALHVQPPNFEGPRSVEDLP